MCRNLPPNPNDSRNYFVESDRRWFSAHPGVMERVRDAGPGEFTPEQLAATEAEVAEIVAAVSKGLEYDVLHKVRVEQLLPGVRARTLFAVVVVGRKMEAAMTSQERD